jgi:hypothetical protein
MPNGVDKRERQTILVGKPEGKRPLERDADGKIISE